MLRCDPWIRCQCQLTVPRRTQVRRITPRAAQPSSSTPSDNEPATATTDSVLERFQDSAQTLADEEAASFLQAQEQLVQYQQASQAAAAAAQAQSQAPTTSQSQQPPSSGGGNPKDSMLARIQAAKKYKEKKPTLDTEIDAPKISTSSSSSTIATSTPSQPSTSSTPEQEENDNNNRAMWLPSEQPENLAATIDKNMRAESFTIKKEELKKDLGASVERGSFDPLNVGKRTQQLTKDLKQEMEQQRSSIAPPSSLAVPDFQADSSSGYKPIVQTWGVFPRPKDISKTYGGGRNIKPGEALETEEEAAARKERVSTAMAAYRKASGLVVDPVVEADCSRLYDEGKVLFDRGEIAAALEKFTQGLDLVPIQCRIGGEVALQKAICLDSLGRNKEAYAIYVKIERHNAPGVAKAAKRMIFGFKAAEDLKVTDLRYAPDQKAWKSYFDQISAASWQASYYKPAEGEEEQDAEAAKAAGVTALLVMATPLLMVAFFIWSR